MKKALNKAVVLRVVLTVGLVSVLCAAPVFADDQVSTSILPGNIGIGGLLKILLNVLMYGLGAAAILGVMIAGIQYMTARDNEAQVKAAKQRLYNVLIGLLAWALMFAVVNWLVPGGLNFDSLEIDGLGASASEELMDVA